MHEKLRPLVPRLALFLALPLLTLAFAPLRTTDNRPRFLGPTGQSHGEKSSSTTEYRFSVG
jgi:hypothetical protein